MEKEKYIELEKIVSYLHKSDDTSGVIDPELKNSDDYKELERIYKLREHVSFLYKQKSEKDIWEEISLRLKPRRLYFNWLKYAAIIILSFSAGLSAIYFSGVKKHKIAYSSITCPKGQITNLTLFDGTKIWLNSESTIKYASDFNSSNREVFVEGEAYFEVTHNKKNPFIVHLKKSDIQVFGTSFNVKSYPESDDVEVILLKGKIEFITNTGSVMLKPNEQVIFSARQGTVKKAQVDTEKTLGWKDGEYFYSNEKLASIIQQIQRWYGVEIVLKNKTIQDYTFTGVIDRKKSIGYNLRTIEMTKRIKIEYSDDKIIITERH